LVDRSLGLFLVGGYCFLLAQAIGVWKL
jgi:hypothetical protein